MAAQTQNQLGLKGAQQCTINNNFYAGPNKKVETIMFEMKKQLDEIHKELRNLTQKTKKGNKTKGIVAYFISFQSANEIEKQRTYIGLL